ncbi:MAG: hypothetical protein OEZ02_15355 [Anaerolineae bacterium]|nr:hypothetical protein [Anaerolineae bacterium]
MNILAPVPNKRNPKPSKMILWLIPALSLIRGCALVSNTQEATTNTTIVSEISADISTHAPSSTNTPEPSATYISTTTPTLHLTQTPLPTLPPDEAQALILALLRDETDCHLPCWFGVTPGGTTWLEAYNFLLSLGTQFKWMGWDVPYIPFVSSGVFAIEVKVPEYSYPHERLFTGFEVKDNIVTHINADADFSLAHLLTTYGKPAEVWIRLNPWGEPPPEIFLGIYYPELNTFALFYNDTSSYSRYGYIYGCFDDLSLGYNYLQLEISSPGQGELLTWEEVAPFNIWDVQPSLEDAIGMDLDIFYETYKNPEKRPCFETPEDMWPLAPIEGS